MPVEFVELAKLIGGIILLIVPGYLWSFFLFKDLRSLERIAFGFVLSLGVFCCGMFVIDVLLGLPLTAIKVFLLLAVYAASSVAVFFYSIYKSGLPKLHLSFLKQPKLLLLVIILAFAAFMIFLPHLSNGYYLPFHVDEWIHWQYSRAVMEQGSSVFIDPYTGSGTIRSLESGFYYITASLKWITGTTFDTIVVFMPAVVMLFMSLIAFAIGERSERKFGLEAAFLIAFVPTTCRMLGPSFYVALAMGLLFTIFIIWLAQLKKLLATLLIPVFIWCVLLIHPPTALACIIITFLYGLVLLLEKEYKFSILTMGLSLIPVGLVFLLASRWGYALQQVIDAFFGGKTFFVDYDLPQIWPSFEHLGFITWILCIIGAYAAFTKGKAIHRTFTLSAIVFIVLIGLYDKMGYGLPIMYERSFMYLFLMVALLAGYGLSELRWFITDHSEHLISKRYQQLLRHRGLLFTVVVCIILLVTVVPAHLSIPYYQMISEDDYATFTWMDDHLDEYRNETHLYDRAAVNPFYASPFSAMTGLHIVSSSMHPIYGYELHTRMEAFLNNNCRDTNFLKQHGISVVYGACTNNNLTMIYPNVCLYPGLNK
jgi:hypothetical protein